jgi:hypothetical protein
VRSLATKYAVSLSITLAISAGSEVHAGWINYTVVLDTPTRVFINVDHVSVGGIPTFGGGIVNWRVVGAEFPVINGFGISIDTNHEIFGGAPNAPHPTDQNPNPTTIQATNTGPFEPGVSSIPLTLVGNGATPHPGPPNHFDWMQVLYMPTAVGTSRLSIQLDHTQTEDRPAFIPEPSTLTLVGLGIIGLVRYGRRRRSLEG